MEKMAQIGGLLKKTYRIYSNQLIQQLEEHGFLDLRVSFLEILLCVSQQADMSIKEIGEACGLKKQTMTSHLNELEKRGYIYRAKGLNDKRELKVNLTEYGVKFKLTLFEVMNKLESEYEDKLGSVELERTQFILKNLHEKISS